MGASLCQPHERDGDQPQPGGGGARAGRPGLRGHVPGRHPGQAGQRGAQGARPCCLSTIYHLIPRQFSISELNLKLKVKGSASDTKIIHKHGLKCILNTPFETKKELKTLFVLEPFLK